MNQRLVISLGVFVVGFGLGYAATHTLVSSPDGDVVEAPGAQTAEVDAKNTATDGVPHALPTASQPAAKKALVQPKGPEAQKLLDAPAKPAVKAASAAPSQTQKWWEACLGQDCLVNFGGVTGGLSLRRGSLEHGKVVDWDLRFKRAKREGIVPTDRTVKVHVLAVGMDSKGRPVAARVRWADQGTTLTGVMSLAPGKKTVTMKLPTSH